MITFIVNKLDVLLLLIDHYNPKLILVTESWLNSCIPDLGYNVISVYLERIVPTNLVEVFAYLLRMI